MGSAERLLQIDNAGRLKSARCLPAAMSNTRSSRQRDKVGLAAVTAALPLSPFSETLEHLLRACHPIQVDYQEASDDDADTKGLGRVIDYQALSARVLGAHLPKAPCLSAG